MAEASKTEETAKIQITLTVNGAAKRMEIAPWTTLLDALREHLGLTGTKRRRV